MEEEIRKQSNEPCIILKNSEIFGSGQSLSMQEKGSGSWEDEGLGMQEMAFDRVPHESWLWAPRATSSRRRRQGSR